MHGTRLAVALQGPSVNDTQCIIGQFVFFSKQGAVIDQAIDWVSYDTEDSIA